MNKQKQIKYFKRLQQLIIENIDSPNREGCLKAMDENRQRILTSPGSSHNHQVYPGGWLKHNVDAIRLAMAIYPTFNDIMNSQPDFSRGDVVLGIFWHDWEKPFKYVDPVIQFNTSMEKQEFVFDEAEKYEINLSPIHRNIIKYIHGEGKDYDPNKKVQFPATALAHAVDTLSARVDISQSLPEMK